MPGLVLGAILPFRWLESWSGVIRSLRLITVFSWLWLTWWCVSGHLFLIISGSHWSVVDCWHQQLIMCLWPPAPYLSNSGTNIGLLIAAVAESPECVLTYNQATLALKVMCMRSPPGLCHGGLLRWSVHSQGYVGAGYCRLLLIMYCKWALYFVSARSILLSASAIKCLLIADTV